MSKPEKKQKPVIDESEKTRLYLFIGSTLALITVVAFLFILNIREPAEYTMVPFEVLLILAFIACGALGFFFAKGPVFDVEGNLVSTNINAMLLLVLAIIQISFFFEIVSVRNQTINYQMYTNIRKDISIAEQTEEAELNHTLEGFLGGSISGVAILDEDGSVEFASDPSLIGTTMEKNEYSYTFERNRSICFAIDKSYAVKELRGIVMNLLTVLVTSIFFSVEIVILMIRFITRNMDRVSPTPEPQGEQGEKPQMLSALYYIRQIAFLFYFASRLSAAFIPILAKSLHNPLTFLSDTAAAGVPQSAETLLTCSAIFITTLLLEKKGWKLPFAAGILLVAVGTLLSAFSANLIMFVLARAIVGLGYGFCWMTLRNLSLFGRDAREQMMGFALLNAGIYAGMNCGSALGAILAEIFGYKMVFVASAAFTLATSIIIIRMENALLPRRQEAQDDTGTKKKMPMDQLIKVIAFVVLMIAPASIACSYLSYYLPLYFESIGRSVADVGRAQLLYGMVIVYAGPFLSAFVAVFRKRGLETFNYVYNLVISLSLLLPGLGAGIVLPFVGAMLLGIGDSFGFGAQNNYFLSMNAVRALGSSKSLSVLSFVKKLLEMTGPIVFAFAIALGYRVGIIVLAISFAAMCVVYFGINLFSRNGKKREVR